VNPVSGALKFKAIAYIDRMDNGFQFVISVGPFSKNVEEKIDFAA
jgi:hypothetical protein